jgi:agmatine/peptidylarginine deiminase
MKNTAYYSLILVFVLTCGVKLSAQDKSVRKPYTLTHHMTPEEKALFHTVGDGYEATDPPPGVVHNIAEFEKMEGVLIAYPNAFGVPYTLIAAMSEVTIVTTIVEDATAQNYVTNQYQSHAVNMDNVNFLVADLNSYWTRDYGPWYVRYGDDQIGIVDFIYNRPNRPDDNAIPPAMADFLGIEWFGMDLITAGGNYMTDGYGMSASSELVWEENPTLTPADIDQMVLDYLGVYEYHVIPDPNNTYIDHIDCWGKYLDVDKVLIREVPESHPQYDEIEATAAYFESQVTPWGNHYEVYRVWTPNNEPYTNSLILNDHVFVPIEGGQWDDEALAAYEEAMPGYVVQGFTGAWESTDALHCRTKGIADRNTLFIEHFPLLGDQPVQAEYEIEAVITAYSGEDINSDDVLLKYWINEEAQPDIEMTFEGDKVYSATLPAGMEGSKMEYYITATDEGGNTGNHPFIGEPDPHVFYVGEELFAGMALDVSEITAWVNQGYVDEQMFNISSVGGLALNYELEASSAILLDYEYELDDSPGQFTWDDNTYTELGWTEFEVDNVVGNIGGWSIDFTWNTDQYGYESTFWAESPDGTQAIIASGIADGTYSISLDTFNGEGMDGTWKVWITDEYGDGGHQATDITVTITKTYTIVDWLSVEPASGSLMPDESQTITVTCDGSILPLGDYVGHIYVTTNDPENEYTDIPVNFTVDYASTVNSFAEDGISINNYPNPFEASTTFEIISAENQTLEVTIYNGNGQLIKNLFRETLQGQKIIHWDGTNESGQHVRKGVYFYLIRVGKTMQTGKLIYME